MKHGSNTRRPRHNGRNNGRNNNPRTQVFDSNGPDVRIRGNASQVHEKYVALARDASVGGDRVLAESYLQHAEHYQRMLNEVQQAQAAKIAQQEASQKRNIANEAVKAETQEIAEKPAEKSVAKPASRKATAKTPEIA